MNSNQAIRYQHLDEVHNLISPKAIVPQIIQHLNPKSVVDVGCGIGTFLSVFQSSGVTDVLGIDGSWVNKEQLYIDNKFFIEADLEKPFAFDKKFDLVLCLEVAEHLSAETAETFIKSLILLGNKIIFSAAIPHQGGQKHLNEQPFSYWQKIFAKYGFYYFDFFRPLFWENKEIEFWYKQNMFLIVHESETLTEAINKTKVANELSVSVHPDLYNACVLRRIELKKKVDDMQQGKKAMSFYLKIILKKAKQKFGSINKQS